MCQHFSYFCSLLKKAAAAFICSALFASAYASTFPSYFDWRRESPDDRASAFTAKIVSSVLDQRETSTCWTFGTLSALESSWNKMLSDAGITSSPFVDPESGYVRFSERYLAWMGKTDPLPASQITPELIDAVYISSGGNEYKAAAGMLAGGLVWETSSPFSGYARGISKKIPPVATLHDVFLAPELSLTALVSTDPGKVKQMISEYGVVSASYGVYDRYMSGADIYTNAVFSNEEELLPFINHQVSLVGWDDDYDFSSSGLNEKPAGRGAWIMKNSWGTQYGDNGYYYVSYEDTSLVFSGAFIPEPDLRRYTLTDTYARFPSLANWYDNTPSLSAGNTYTASAPQFVKAVGFYADQDKMNYTIEIRTKADTPESGRIVYTQNGSFGSDGTPEWAGYRTVDLDSLVFIPKGEEYFVTITLSNEDGTGIIRHYLTDAEAGKEEKSFVYEKGKWINAPEGYVFSFYVQSKHTFLPAAENFTVVSLDDGGTGNAVINLGKAGEKYGYDILHPDRETLSTMTVDLTAGKTDSVFGGVIIGEGGLIKTGTGTLELRGLNTYTGATEVRSGMLHINGGTSNSPISVQTGARMKADGNAVFQKDIFSQGTLDISDSAFFSAVSGTGDIYKSGTGTAFFAKPSSAGSYTVRADGGNGTTELAAPLNVGNFVLETDHTLRSVISGTGYTDYGRILIADVGSINLNGHTLNIGFSFPLNLLNKGESLTVEAINKPAGNTGTLLWADTVQHNNMYAFTPVSDTAIEIRRTATPGDVIARGGGSLSEGFAANVLSKAGGTGPVLSVLDDLAAHASPAAYRRVVASVMPDSRQTTRQQARSGSELLFSALNTRQDTLSGFTGRSGGEAAKFGAWGKYLYNHTQSRRAFTGRTNGFIIGADAELSEETTAGIGSSVSKTALRAEGPDTASRKTDMTTYTLFGYGRRTEGRAVFDAAFSYAHLRADETKILSRDKYSMEQAAAQAMAGYGFSWFVPTAGIRYIYSYEHGRRDSAGQQIKSSDAHLAALMAGGRLYRQFSDFSVKASVYAAYDIVSEKSRTNVFLPNGTGYAVDGERAPRFGMEVAAGISYALNGRTEIKLDYAGVLKRDYQSHTGMVNLKYEF